MSTALCNYDFRCGDEPSAYGPMRLTVGGLAEIAARLETPDAGSLAVHIRRMSPLTARYLAAALLRPCGNAAVAADLTEAELAALMPAAARCVITALAARS